MPIKLIPPLLFTLTLGACANTGADYSPIIDGPRDQAYSTDLNSCQKVADKRGYTNGDVQTDALIGAALGAAVGAIEDDWEGALVGALIGGALGGAGRAFDTQDERKAIVVTCMRNRGHNVVG